MLLARLHALGGSDDAAYGVVAQIGGAIVVAGGNAGRMVLLRYRGDGTPDPAFGSGGQVVDTMTGPARALVSQPDGKLLTVSADATRFWISRYSADGRLDPAFGTGGKASATVGQGAVAHALALQADGKIVVAGGRAGNVALARLVLRLSVRAAIRQAARKVGGGSGSVSASGRSAAPV